VLVSHTQSLHCTSYSYTVESTRSWRAPTIVTTSRLQRGRTRRHSITARQGMGRHVARGAARARTRWTAGSHSHLIGTIACSSIKPDSFRAVNSRYPCRRFVWQVVQVWCRVVMSRLKTDYKLRSGQYLRLTAQQVRGGIFSWR